MRSNLNLSVLLKNPNGTPLNINRTTSAVLLSHGKKQKATISFPTGVVPANGVLEGEIKVAGHDLDPSTYVLVPLMPMKGQQTLHLHAKQRISVMPGPCNPE
jgi:hypothetical protein